MQPAAMMSMYAVIQMGRLPPLLEPDAPLPPELLLPPALEPLVPADDAPRELEEAPPEPERDELPLRDELPTLEELPVLEEETPLELPGRDDDMVPEEPAAEVPAEEEPSRLEACADVADADVAVPDEPRDELTPTSPELEELSPSGPPLHATQTDKPSHAPYRVNCMRSPWPSAEAPSQDPW